MFLSVAVVPLADISPHTRVMRYVKETLIRVSRINNNARIYLTRKGATTANLKLKCHHIESI